MRKGRENQGVRLTLPPEPEPRRRRKKERRQPTRTASRKATTALATAAAHRHIAAGSSHPLRAAPRGRGGARRRGQS
nr:unnamed protein product [Digitaria exilis]